MKTSKNIHLIATNEPSRLFYSNNDPGLKLNKYPVLLTFERSPQYIYITSDEYIGLSWYLDGDLVRKGVVDDKDYWEVRKDYKKIVLTNNPDLFNNGVQEIGDNFLEWFVQNPSCERVEIEKQYITPLGDIVDFCYDNERLNYKITIPHERLRKILGEVPIQLDSVLAKITHQNDLGLSQWYEVVYYADDKWCSYNGSKTFEDGEKVVEWKYCKELI